MEVNLSLEATPGNSWYGAKLYITFEQFKCKYSTLSQ